MEENDREQQAQERGGIGWGTIAWVFCTLLVIYVLSVGPVAKIYRGKSKQPPVAVLGIYAPLEFSYKHSSVVKRFIDWYLRDVWKCKG